MSNFLIEKTAGFGFIKLQGGYNSALPITTTGLITGGSAQINGNLVVTGSITGGSEMTTSQVITAASANAFAVGANGTTNPAFNIDTSASSVATGLNIAGAAAGSGLALTVLSSGTNENLTINAKGSGTISLNTANNQPVNFANGTLISGSGALAVTSTSTNAIVVGPNGTTNPSFRVNANTASAVTGLLITSAASGGGLAVTTISSGSNENLTFNAKGTGTLQLQSAIVAASGGAASSGVQIGSIGVGFYTGTGAPTFSAMNGSVYVDSNATTTTTRIYVNKSGAGTAGTTWTNLTTAA